jgi:mono/diheme cytochrome c family protein
MTRGRDERGKVKTAKKRFNKSSGAWQLVLAFALMGAAIPAAGRQAQTAPNAGEQFTRLIQSVEGPDLFRAYCAPCHGIDATGAGPVAPARKAKVPDLTLLSRNNGGQFPAAYVRQTILGDKTATAHGSREMPIWGPIFHQVERDMDWGNVRLENLVKYLESMQPISAGSAPSGAELYKQHCAACHGTDLKGTGPAPRPFRTPPDLTTLARRHGGKFPDAYVSSVLRDGVVMPEHGPADMPIWGADFATGRLGEAQVSSRIALLTNYIKSLQAK